jgi:hypothetical protein
MMLLDISIIIFLISKTGKLILEVHSQKCEKKVHKWRFLSHKFYLFRNAIRKYIEKARPCRRRRISFLLKNIGEKKVLKSNFF